MHPRFDSCQIPTSLYISSSKIKRSVDDKRTRREMETLTRSAARRSFLITLTKFARLFFTPGLILVGIASPSVTRSHSSIEDIFIAFAVLRISVRV